MEEQFNGGQDRVPPIKSEIPHINLEVPCIDIASKIIGEGSLSSQIDSSTFSTMNTIFESFGYMQAVGMELNARLQSEEGISYPELTETFVTLQNMRDNLNGMIGKLNVAEGLMFDLQDIEGKEKKELNKGEDQVQALVEEGTDKKDIGDNVPLGVKDDSTVIPVSGFDSSKKESGQEDEEEPTKQDITDRILQEIDDISEFTIQAKSIIKDYFQKRPHISLIDKPVSMDIDKVKFRLGHAIGSIHNITGKPLTSLSGFAQIIAGKVIRPEVDKKLEEEGKKGEVSRKEELIKEYSASMGPSIYLHYKNFPNAKTSISKWIEQAKNYLAKAIKQKEHFTQVHMGVEELFNLISAQYSEALEPYAINWSPQNERDIQSELKKEKVDFSIEGVEDLVYNLATNAVKAVGQLGTHITKDELHAASQTVPAVLLRVEELAGPDGSDNNFQFSPEDQLIINRLAASNVGNFIPEGQRYIKFVFQSNGRPLPSSINGRGFPYKVGGWEDKNDDGLKPPNIDIGQKINGNQEGMYSLAKYVEEVCGGTLLGIDTYSSGQLVAIDYPEDREKKGKYMFTNMIVVLPLQVRYPLSRTTT